MFYYKFEIIWIDIIKSGLDVINNERDNAIIIFKVYI